RMRARGVHAYGDYMRILEGDAREFDLLLDALTINVTKLFRNWDVFDTIARSVIPELWTRLEGPIHVWSAGCASGEEPYSLAILFHRHAAERGELHRLGRVTIHATDIDRGSLATAARACYGAAAFADTPPELRAAYFSREEPAAVASEARRLVRVARHDLLLDPPPARELHLIVCRNVIIYFDRATQESLFERFHDALAPGGYLVLGKVETLLGSARSRLAAVHPRERIFRRP
ncbi:MAG TPA: protein-glutamate O-methyltransferase CheR, partial [Gemmatimonadaceae bacterium]|nr:protein-glutamate O-methyltransferase CheR [Gemmatimonadaceae bacterium]